MISTLDSVGADCDPVDVFLGPDLESELVFVIDQVDETGEYNEAKAVIGVRSERQARDLYLSNYEPGWRCGDITAFTVDDFKAWLKNAAKTRLPASREKAALEQARVIEAWVSYRGPRGGTGWRSTITGRVKYQDEKPGEDQHSAQEEDPFDSQLSVAMHDFTGDWDNFDYLLDNYLDQDESPTLAGFADFIEDMAYAYGFSDDETASAEAVAAHLTDRHRQALQSAVTSGEATDQQKNEYEDEIGELPTDETPRETASRNAARLDEDYAFARDSSVPNAGEDLLGSARHKRNEWRGLDEAEREGTATSLVTKAKLLRNEPPDFVSIIDEGGDAWAALTMHYALNMFPGKPGYGGKRYKPTEDEAKADRRQYVEAYRRIKEEAEELARRETSPSVAAGKLRSTVTAMIHELREEDRYNSTANALVSMSKNLYWNPYRSSSRSISGKLNDFARAAQKQYGFTDLKELAEKQDVLDKVADHAKDIMEGSSLNKSFGVEREGPGRFKPDSVYMKKIQRVGGRNLDAATANEAVSHLVDNMGMRGVQWGNSVTDSERQHHAVKIAESFLDLADVTGLPDSMMSLGTLGLAVGARGHGGALAHYEASTKIINMTRTNGVGSLAHEWGHFFDNMASGSKQFHSEQWNGPIKEPFDALEQSWKDSGYTRRLAENLRQLVREKRMSYEKANAYWASNREMFARCFERHVQRRLESQGRQNTYLAGINAHAWEGEAETFGQLWPTDEEVDAMAPHFDAIFEAFKAKGVSESAVPSDGRRVVEQGEWQAFQTRRGTTGAYNQRTREKAYGEKARRLLAAQEKTDGRDDLADEQDFTKEAVIEGRVVDALLSKLDDKLIKLTQRAKERPGFMTNATISEFVDTLNRPFLTANKIASPNRDKRDVHSELELAKETLEAHRDILQNHLRHAGEVAGNGQPDERNAFFVIQKMREQLLELLPSHEHVTRSDVADAETANAPQGAKSIVSRPGVKAELTETDDVIRLENLNVADKRQGIGSSVMSDLVSYADEHGKTIRLTPDDSYGTPLSVLNKFYAGFGFVSRGMPSGALERKPQSRDNETSPSIPDTPVGNWAKERFKDPKHAANFVKWFGDSKVVDDNGAPLVVFHGTGGDFTEFRPGDDTRMAGGIFFTDDPKLADTKFHDKPTHRVDPYYVAMSNPFMFDYSNRKGSLITNIRRAKELGHDGVIAGDSWPEIQTPGKKMFIAFDPNQIKSATGNQGTFDPDSNKITEQVIEQEWQPFQTRRGTTGAVNSQGKRLYGTDAERALKGDEDSGSQQHAKATGSSTIKTKSEVAFDKNQEYAQSQVGKGDHIWIDSSGDVLRYPSHSMGSMAHLSFDDYDKFDEPKNYVTMKNGGFGRAIIQRLPNGQKKVLLDEGMSRRQKRAAIDFGIENKMEIVEHIGNRAVTHYSPVSEQVIEQEVSWTPTTLSDGTPGFVSTHGLHRRELPEGASIVDQPTFQKQAEQPQPKLSKEERAEKADYQFEELMKTKAPEDADAFRKARGDGIAIPPAWTEVTYYGADKDIRAEGRDGKGRKQRAENPEYRQRISDENNARIAKELTPRMNEVRDTLREDALAGYEESRVLYLIAMTGFRIGGSGDTKAKEKAYGASTLKGEHVEVDGDTVRFDFPGKKGVRQEHSITDPVIADMMRGAESGKPIFSTRDTKVRAAWQGKYGGTKVHDMRHVVASEIADAELHRRIPPPPKNPRERKRLIKEVATVTAGKLGNNPSQALATYIDPGVWKPLQIQAIDQEFKNPTARAAARGEIESSHEHPSYRSGIVRDSQNKDRIEAVIDWAVKRGYQWNG